MSMTVLIVGVGMDSLHAIEVAHENGLYVAGIDGNPNAEGLECVDEAYVTDIKEIDKVTKLVAKIIPRFVIPVPIGRYLSVVGIINDEFSLKGISRKATEVSTDKYLFHKELSKNGLRNIRVGLIERDSNEDISKDFELPAFIKPRYGSGSRDIFYVKDKISLNKTLQIIKEKKEDFLLEQQVVGTEFGLDGAVIDGKTYLILIRKKRLTPIPVRQAISYLALSYNENMELYTRVYKFIERAVTCLCYNNCLLHADIIVNDERIFLIEMAPRPSGHNLHDVFVPLATGIDCIDEFIKYNMGKPYSFVTDSIRNIQINYFSFEDVYMEYIPTEEEVRAVVNHNLVKWNCNISKGDYMSKILDGHSIIPRGYYIIEGNNEIEINNYSEKIIGLFKFVNKTKK